MNANGNAMAVWSQMEVSRNDIWANRYTAGTGWGTAAPIDAGTLFLTKPELAMNASGSAMATWLQYAGSSMSVSINRFD
jgi:hypothetical protein